MNPTLHILEKYSLLKTVLNKLQSVGRITSELALIISFAIESLPHDLIVFNNKKFGDYVKEIYIIPLPTNC